MNITVRAGLRSDLTAVHQLIMELAEYEQASKEVTTTVEQLELDGFGPSPLYGFFVAERDGIVIGLSLFYWRYSTWKGKRLYLEDIIVTESERGNGVGKLLFERTCQYALDQQCSGMMWQVLHWNEPAIHFYKKFEAKFDREWVNVSLEADQLQKLTK